MCVVLIDCVFLKMRMEMRMGCVLTMRIITMVSPLFSCLLFTIYLFLPLLSHLTQRRLI